MATIRLGKTDRGELVTVEIKLETLDREAYSVRHEYVPADKEQRLSITGVVYRNARMTDGNIVSAGQCQDALLHIVTPEKSWTIREIRELYALWVRWHLNDMRAGCAHQTSVIYEDGPYGTRVNFKATNEANDCPQSYPFGSSWLFEELPDEVVARVKEFQQR